MWRPQIKQDIERGQGASVTKRSKIKQSDWVIDDDEIGLQSTTKSFHESESEKETSFQQSPSRDFTFSYSPRSKFKKETRNKSPTSPVYPVTKKGIPPSQWMNSEERSPDRNLNDDRMERIGTKVMKYKTPAGDVVTESSHSTTPESLVEIPDDLSSPVNTMTRKMKSPRHALADREFIQDSPRTTLESLQDIDHVSPCPSSSETEEKNIDPEIFDHLTGMRLAQMLTPTHLPPLPAKEQKKKKKNRIGKLSSDGDEHIKEDKAHTSQFIPELHDAEPNEIFSRSILPKKDVAQNRSGRQKSSVDDASLVTSHVIEPRSLPSNFEDPNACVQVNSGLTSFNKDERQKGRRRKSSVGDTPLEFNHATAPHFVHRKLQDCLQNVQSSNTMDSSPKAAELKQLVSSPRPSEGSTSLDGSRSLTPMSENRSYREKLRSRLQSVREQAGVAVVEASSRSRLRSRLKSEPTLSRFDDLHKEEVQLGEALGKHKYNQLRWKQAAQVATELPDDETSCNFFTEVWEPELEERPEHQSPASALPSDLEAATTERAEDNTKLLAAEFLGLQDEWDLVESVQPENIDWNELTNRVKNLYFSPKTQQVPLEEKLPPDHMPRYPETEGLYVGPRIWMPNRNKAKLEWRILNSGERRWFGDDGDVISPPDPRRSIAYRPPIMQDIFPTMEIEYIPCEKSITNSSIDIRDGKENYLLVLELTSITFTHHSLFSREHVLAQHLVEQHQKLVEREELNHVLRMTGRLVALRQARNRLKEVLKDMQDPDPQQIEQLQKYRMEINDLRVMQHGEGRNDRQLLTNTLVIWQEIKKLRSLQGFTATPWRLKIHTQPPDDPEVERQEWEQLIQIEWEELEEIQTELYNERLKEYSEELALWKKKRKSLREAQMRQQQEEEQRIETDDNSQTYYDSKGSIDKLGQEPQPPTPVNWASFRTELVDHLVKCFRPPGEPQLRLELCNSEKVESIIPCPREMQRRVAVSSYSLHIRIFFNESEVCRLSPKMLGPQFEVLVNEILTICIAQWPQSLRIELYDHPGFVVQHRVAVIYVPIPASSTTLHTAERIQLEFSNDSVVSYAHSGMGCGMFSNLFPGNNNPTSLYTSGFVTLKTGWGFDETSEKILSPQDLDDISGGSSDITDFLMSSRGPIDAVKLQKWAETTQMDPNDPKNSNFFSSLQDASMGVNAGPTCFRLEPTVEEFNFCSIEDLGNNPRLRLLQLRDRGEPEFRGMTLVPNNEKDIHGNVFKAFEERKSAPPLVPDTTVGDTLESHRLWGQRFLQDVRQRVLKMCHKVKQHRQLQDIITEDQVPDIGTLGLTFMKWLQPKRPLRPIRKERKKVAVHSLGGHEVKIIVNVVRAFDVPIRKDLDLVRRRGSVVSTSLINAQRFNFVPVRPFVEVSFQNVTARTTTAEGANPTWNQELQLPLHPPSGDFSPGSLLDIQDALHLHLFDETVIDLLEDDRTRDTNIHQRLERHWLGSLRIPFSTLYHNDRIEGSFKLYSPPVLLGYERIVHHQFTGFLLPGEIPTTPQESSTFLTLFITVQPALNPPEPFKEQLESAEPSHLQDHLKSWQEQVLAQFPHRRLKTLVIDVSGKSVCVTRFFRPLNLPVVTEGETTSSFMAARFVSMIPMVSGSVLFPGFFDVWLTSDQVMNLLSGDSEDHAVLLCCYLLHQGQHAWLLLGAGIPHGPTAYVLEQGDEGSFWLWDPASGERYDVHDNFCPLQKVYCLINDENIWANIQPDELPSRTNYDVNRRSDWWPAFGRTLSAPIGSIQPLTLEYKPTSKSAVSLLQDKIEKHLRDCLMKWRRTSRTLWNRYCVAILRKILPVLEHDACHFNDENSVDYLHELQHVMSSHKICGFPINLPYTNMDTITESVQATGVHFCESPEVEFALAVYIHPYPNNVLSVWVYVASLMRRR